MARDTKLIDDSFTEYDEALALMQEALASAAIAVRTSAVVIDTLVDQAGQFRRSLGELQELVRNSQDQPSRRTP